MKNHHSHIKNLKSLGNDKYSDLVNYEYWPIYKSNNQMLFTHMFYDKKNNIIFNNGFDYYAT